jgi:hypothetical protein
MRGLACHRSARLALAALCAVAINGCSLDLVAVSFCASEQQSVAIGAASGRSSLSSVSSSQTAVRLAVGDSVRLVAQGFCGDAGLRVEIASSRARWSSHDPAIVRVSRAASGAAEDAAAWAVGTAPGSTVVAADVNGSLATIEVTVR